MEAFVITLKYVVVAWVVVEFVNIAVEGVTLPMGVFSMVPPEIVNASVTNVSVTEFVGSVNVPPFERVNAVDAIS